MKKIINTLLFINFTILSGCGGSSTSSGSDVSFTTLSRLYGGQGVARGIDGSGEQTLVYASEIVEFVASDGDDTSIEVSDLPITSRTGNTIIRKGFVTSGGSTFNVTAVENSTVADAHAVFIETPGFVDTSAVNGTAFSSPPSTGSYSYTGTQTIHSRTAAAPGSIGTFSMAVDFGANVFSYSGSSGSFTVSGSGVLDDVNGRFSTSALSVRHSAGYDYGGSMYGLLHGDGATDTSGIDGLYEGISQ